MNNLLLKQQVRTVRAGIAQTPESSEFTSVRERFEAECAAHNKADKFASR